MMQTDDKNFETLLKLGLTKLQAEAYIASIKLGDASVKEIAEVTKIDRAHIYQIMSKLQQIGLINKILSNPCLYKALPLHVGAQILLERKAQEMVSIKKLVQDIPKMDAEVTTPSLESQFMLIPGKETHIREFGKIMRKCSVTFDHVFPCQKDFFNFLLIKKGKDDIFRGHFLKNNVNVRTILCNPSNEKPPKNVSEQFDQLKKNGNFDFRYSSECAAAMFAILDDKAVYMHVGQGATWKDKPGLYSNNFCLVGMAKGYFEYLWQNTRKDP